MPINNVELAAQITIYAACAAASWVYVWWQDEKKTRQEERAAILEYEDEDTSDARRERLLIRYPKLFVSAPGYRYTEAARKEEREKKLSWRDRFKVGGCLIPILLFSLLFGYLAEILIKFVAGLIHG